MPTPTIPPSSSRANAEPPKDGSAAEALQQQISRVSGSSQPQTPEKAQSEKRTQIESELRNLSPKERVALLAAMRKKQPRLGDAPIVQFDEISQKKAESTESPGEDEFRDLRERLDILQYGVLKDRLSKLQSDVSHVPEGLSDFRDFDGLEPAAEPAAEERRLMDRLPPAPGSEEHSLQARLDALKMEPSGTDASSDEEQGKPGGAAPEQPVPLSAQRIETQPLSRPDQDLLARFDALRPKTSGGGSEEADKSSEGPTPAT